MYLISLAVVYLFWGFALIAINYYVHLYLKQDQFSKEELKNVFPFFVDVWNHMIKVYSPFTLGVVVLIASIVGILFAQVPVLDSAIPFAILYFFSPSIIKYLKEKQMMETDNMQDRVSNIIMLYQLPILFGFGLGSLAALTLNWGNDPAIHSLWYFLVNVIAYIVLQVYVIKAMLDIEG